MNKLRQQRIEVLHAKFTAKSGEYPRLHHLLVSSDDDDFLNGLAGWGWPGTNYAEDPLSCERQAGFCWEYILQAARLPSYPDPNFYGHHQTRKLKREDGGGCVECLADEYKHSGFDEYVTFAKQMVSIFCENPTPDCWNQLLYQICNSDKLTILGDCLPLPCDGEITVEFLQNNIFMESAYAIEMLADGQPPAVNNDHQAGKGIGNLSVNDRMMQIFTRDHRCIGWSQREWADKLKVTPKAVGKTAAWKAILAERDSQKKALDKGGYSASR